MRIGERVRMTEGPFLGMYGAVVSSVRRRVVLAVVLGSREVQIEIERDGIAAITALRQVTSRVENSKAAAS